MKDNASESDRPSADTADSAARHGAMGTQCKKLISRVEAARMLTDPAFRSRRRLWPKRRSRAAGLHIASGTAERFMKLTVLSCGRISS
jgi:hypothetical protein